MIETLMNMDIGILLWIQDYMRFEWLNPVFVFITTLGNAGMIWILFTIVMLIPKKTRKVGLMCACALILSVVVNNVILKNLVARPRPFDTFQNLIPLVPRPEDYSFPSGHTSASVMCACLMFRKLPRKYGIPAIILAILIAFSRLYLGVHYPSDVIGGIISGVLISYLAEFIVETISIYLDKRKVGEK